MSRRKQKRPQQLVNADPGGEFLPSSQDDQFSVKSPSNSLASEPTSSSSSSPSPTSLQDCQPPLAPRPSPCGLHAPSLPSESSSPSHWTNHIVPYNTALPNTHSSLSPDFPHPSLSSQTQSPPPVQQNSAHIPVHQPNSTVSSPQMGISATTTTSTTSSSSSLNSIPHPRSPGSIQQAPSSPPEDIQVPSTLAVLLEELRVLQQRQIHQMQMTEEICRQVLRLGGVISNQDIALLENHQKPSGPMSPPLSTSGPSQSIAPPSIGTLIPQSVVSKSNMSHTNVTRDTYSSSTSIPSSSSLVPSGAVMHPLSLSLGFPRYLHEKSANTSLSHASTVSFPTPPLLTTSTQEQLSVTCGVGLSGGSSSNGRQQHVCRFCGKVLSSDSSLQIHLRSHTGERPYQCPVCLSRFTTRGNLKAHFLRHREQNPELSLSLLPPALSEQSQSGSSSGVGQRRRKRRADEEESFTVKGAVGVPDGLALGFLSGSSSHMSASSLPLPPTVDLALLSTAHSLLQLNHASASAVTSGSASILSPASTTSSASSAITSQIKSSKQQRFDENTPPHSAIHPTSPYSQLAHLPKILFPSGPSPHHAGLTLLRPPHLSSPHPQLTFPFSPYLKHQTSSSSSPSSNAISDTSKLQRLAQKLEKQPPTKSLTDDQNNGSTQPSDISTTSGTNTISEYRREIMTALGLNPNPSSEISTNIISGSIPSLPTLVPNQCGVCLRVLSCPRALRLHQATHLGERPFPCKLCGRSFSTKGSLRAHLATHRARPPNTRTQNSCPLCQRKFTNAVVLQHHIRMHLGGQLPPEGHEDLVPGEEAGEIGSVTLQKAIQSLPLNMSTSVTSCTAGTLQSSISSEETNQAVDTDKDACDTADNSLITPNTEQVFGKQDHTSLSTRDIISTNSFPLEDDPNSNVHHSVVGTYALTAFKPQHKFQMNDIIKSTKENDENTPLSLCTRSSSLDTFPNSRDLSGPSHHAVISDPKCNIQSAALDLSPALTPPSSPSQQLKPEPKVSQKFTPSIGTFLESKQSKDDSLSKSESIPKSESNASIVEKEEDKSMKHVDAQKSNRDEEANKLAEMNNASWIEDEKEIAKTKLDITAIPQNPPRSDKPYSCSQCGKEYASRSGLKGHMKTHSGGTNSGMNVSVVATQSLEENKKDSLEANLFQPGGNLQEGIISDMEKSSEKLASVETTLTAGEKVPEDRA